MSISATDHERISTAIRDVEAKTSGEIVCVLAQTSSDVAALPVVLAAVAALALPWLLVAFTAMTVRGILSFQVLTFLALAGIFWLPRVRVALTPRSARRAIAHRAALQQFEIRGIALTKERSGILIFVSLAERYARIVADVGIAARVPQIEWQAAVDALVAHMRDGRIADGFIAAVELCGSRLARQFPRTNPSRDELPNKIHLI
jgi:putative membrane protein